MKTKIMFVCMGNICRSPLAESVFKHLAAAKGKGDDFEAASSGVIAYHVGEQADARMRAVAASRGIGINHKAQQLTNDHLESYDLILVMDRSNLTEVRSMCQNKENLKKVAFFRKYDKLAGPDQEVPDPYYGGRSGFEDVFEIVHRTCAGLLEQLVHDGS